MRTFFHALNRKSLIIIYMSIKAGNLLRETREAKGVSLKEASDSLHIRLPYLHALEGGRAEIIPSAVQARGFLRIYAEYLDLDAAMIIHEWDNPSPDEAETPTAPAAEDRKNTTFRPKFNPFARHSASTETQVPQSVPQPRQPVQQQPYTPPQNTQATPPAQQQTRQPYVPQPSGTGFVPRQQTPMPSSITTPSPAPEEKPKTKEAKPKKEKRLFAFPHIGRKKAKPESAEPAEKTPQEIFNEIGAKLAFRRKALSLSVEDCEIQTLIRAIYIESMEQGKFEQLPSFMQARGMLNNYAAFLDFDVDDIMLQFATALQKLTLEKNSQTFGKKHKPTKRAGKFKSFFTPDLFVGIFVIVGIAGIIIYSAVAIASYRRSVAEPTAAFNLLDQYHSTTHTPIVLETETATPSIDNLQMLIAETEAAAEEESAEETSTSPVRIFVTANQRAYMRVTADGKEVFSGRTLPGNTYPFDAESLIELTTGNAAALSVVYNQQNLGTLGNLGQILTINFSPYIAATPTPQFSPTPTNTYEPTYTSMPETPLPTNTPTPYIP